MGGPLDDDLEISMDDEEVTDILKALFPELTDDEIDELAASLSLEAALDLKLEIGDIRDVAAGLSAALEQAAEAALAKRGDDLAPHNDGFPLTIEPLGRRAFYDSAAGTGRIELSGVFRDRSAVALVSSDVRVSVAGELQPHELACLHQGQSVDVVFLVDITGSMSPVIDSVQRSLGKFVDAIVAAEIQGTISVVTFQDSVGVNVTFQQPAPASGFERSPFFTPVAIDDGPAVNDLQRFITALEANSGEDAPENLAGAIDFAQNGVIGLTGGGAPNVIGDGEDDPPDVSPWPALRSERQIFVAISDAPFHADSRDAGNSSLREPFEPRPIADILRTLHEGGTTVHVSDPSWVDESVAATGSSSEVSVDSDLWAVETGGLGEDRAAGYSLVDLDLLVLAEDNGLLDIVLDGITASTCTVSFALPNLAAGASFDLQLDGGSDGDTFAESLEPLVY
jgi:hypothetical protein